MLDEESEILGLKVQNYRVSLVRVLRSASDTMMPSWNWPEDVSLLQRFKDSNERHEVNLTDIVGRLAAYFPPSFAPPVLFQVVVSNRLRNHWATGWQKTGASTIPLEERAVG